MSEIKFPKIDIHCHTTRRLLTGLVGADASIQAIEAEMVKYNIHYTVLLATYFPQKKTGITNYRMLHWIQNSSASSKFVLFGSLDFEHYFYQGLNELNELAEQSLIKGIKIYAGYQTILSEQLEEVLRICQKYQLPAMIHTGDCFNTNGKSCADINSLDLNFIYSHLGNPHIGEVQERIQRYKNIYTDISGLINSAKDSKDIPALIKSVKNLVATCGVSQLMFGTDFPVQTHKDSILIAEKGLKGVSDADKHHFYYNNAAKLLKLT
jgi:predicted TIM-barrel fold metal-dependent hydrolase